MSDLCLNCGCYLNPDCSCQILIDRNEYEIIRVKSIRYDALENVYLNQNEKHFGQILTEYFEEHPITKLQKSEDKS